MDVACGNTDWMSASETELLTPDTCKYLIRPTGGSFVLDFFRAQNTDSFRLRITQPCLESQARRAASASANVTKARSGRFLSVLSESGRRSMFCAAGNRLANSPTLVFQCSPCTTSFLQSYKARSINYYTSNNVPTSSGRNLPRRADIVFSKYWLLSNFF